MTLQDFIAKYAGKGIDFDGAYGDQCVDLMNQYLVDVLGITNPIQVLGGATAYQIYQNSNDSRFTKIDNTPTGIPQAGDIVFWNTTVGAAGHVDVFISGDANNFIGFDQNWPVGSLCHQQDHNYNGVAGWLHFNQPVAQPTEDPLAACLAQHAQLVTECNDKQSTIDSQKTTIDSLNQQINDRNNDIVQLNAQISTLHTQLLGSTQEVDTLKPLALQVQGLKEQLAQAVNDRTLCLNAQETQNKTIAALQAGKPKGFVNKLLWLFS